MTVWLHFPTIGVEINISNGSLKFVKKIMQYHSFELDLKCLEILECINEKICIIRICSNYTKCVILKWAKSILTLYPCCIVCVCITSTQDASHRSRRKSCHYKNEKRKKNILRTLILYNYVRTLLQMDRQFIPIELVSNIGPAGSIAIMPVNKGFFSLDAQVSFLLYS